MIGIDRSVTDPDKRCPAVTRSARSRRRTAQTTDGDRSMTSPVTDGDDRLVTDPVTDGGPLDLRPAAYRSRDWVFPRRS